MIGRHNSLKLHKSEWDRLRRKSCPETIDCKREEYFKSLLIKEQSQNCIKLWSDKTQEHINRPIDRKTVEDSKLKQFALKNKEYNKDNASQRAKELIFADSCYGRQLISALLESKTVEERDLQIKFKKQIKENAVTNNLLLTEPKGISLLNPKQMEIEETRNNLRREQIAKEVAKCNATMVEMQKEKRLKEKEEKKLELEDMRLNDEFIKRNADIQSKVLYQEKQAIKEHEAENKKIKEIRAKRDEQDELMREIWRKYQKRVRFREKAVFYKIHHEKYDSPLCQKVFKTIQNSEENKNKKYDEFVQKGIERWLHRSNKEEQKEIKFKTSLHTQRKLLDEENKIYAVFQNRRRIQESDKNVCCGQCILPKCGDVKKLEDIAKNNVKLEHTFLVPRNKHLEDFQSRQKEASSWTALKASHEQFSQHASKTLQECRYKKPARKVVDEYRRLNSLDSKSLPVSNYY